jgi:putative phosphoesterase
MKLAIMSDIHSNKYALKEVFHFLNGQKIDKFIFLGDFFGYYPWAQETFELIKPNLNKSIQILGNHDSLIIQNETPEILPEYWDVIQHNKQQLPDDVLFWLKELTASKNFEIDGLKFKIFHGTPDDPLMGRFYPDDMKIYDWFPQKGEIILLGHTHYPILKNVDNGGIIINPGSVGQSRDGNLSSSFCILDTLSLEINFYRVPYDTEKVISELLEMKWYPRAVNSLKKCNG